MRKVACLLSGSGYDVNQAPKPGLAIARQIVEEVHRGILTCHSQRG
ncbi:MAG: hypothetical protein O2890_04335 [Cyanobacteria bacterium]|nr:hypothetical protein [Cyanobacteriota bacterium]MDA0865634.1 hypothetical protein [Cyanobacteriota bacterium]